VPTKNIFGLQSVWQGIAPPAISRSSKANQLRWLWLGFGLTGVAMLSATAGALLAVSLSATPLMQRQLSPQEAAVFNQGGISTTNLRLPELTRPVNILILGTKVLASELGEKGLSKARYDATVNSLEGLSDTMLLLRFDPQTKKLVLLSIPRDTRSLVEGIGITKINAANAYGGPALSAQAVSDLLGGIRIDRYVRINVQGVEKLVDAVGGVTVYVPQDMKYKDDTQHLYIDLKAGRQHMNGEKALQLLRFRYDRLGDVGRVQRQQMVMRAMMEQALNPTTLGRVPQILKVIQSHIDTNLTVEELMALVSFAVGMDRSDTQMLLVPGEYSAVGQYDASYWLPSKRSISNMMAQYFNWGEVKESRRSTAPANKRIAIQDSTQNPKAVQALVNQLTKAGYRNVSVVEAWNEPLGETRIVAQQGDAGTAQAIRQALDLGEVRVESTGHLDSDVTIKLGRDWLVGREDLENKDISR
jgi:polyisoprenyl-teichoic acid--peptidoglycan teichoic acid transferase